MKTWQDFLQAENKEAFIINAITEFKCSDRFTRAIDAQSYYRGVNTTINNRTPMRYGKNGLTRDYTKTNNKISNGFFPKIIKQEVGYLLGNGLTTDDKIKKGLGKKFDSKLMTVGTYACVDSIGWAYCFINSKGQFDIQMWRGTEAFPLYDERTGSIMAVIRFWQLQEDKPIYVELYEEDGKTEYKSNSQSASIVNLEVTKPKAPYIIKKTKTILGEEVAEENFSVLPVFPLFANDIEESEFSNSLKTNIDLYDIILSDFGNNLEDNRDVYWVLKNYNGQDIEAFHRDFKEYKALKVEDDGDATPHTLEVPYQAREVALEIIRKEIYADAMALDTSVLSGGSLTNVAIKANMQDLDLKTDGFEACVTDFVDNIINLYLEYSNSNIDYKIEFIRRSLINDTEIVDNIYKMRNDISHKTALKLNPYIEKEQEELDNIAEEGLDKYKIEVQEEV